MSPGALPLFALLSQALVAFTIEFDNEAEHRLPHWTTNHGRTAEAPHAVWLVSLAMWFNCMQYVTDDGITVKELERLASTETNLNGMQRWGYIAVEPGSNGLIHATPAGRQAQQIWRPLIPEMEHRWEQRFGQQQISRLRELLLALVRQFRAKLPDCLPILGYGLYSEIKKAAFEEQTDYTLPALLAKVLLAFALHFERQAEISLAISANILRLVAHEPVRTRDLPDLAGISKEAVAVALGFLEKRGYALTGTDPLTSRFKTVALTAKGQAALTEYHKVVPSLEATWKTRFGKDAINDLHKALEEVQTGLFEGLKPYADGWRAKTPELHALPHYPMVSHRGGYPDGS